VKVIFPTSTEDEVVLTVQVPCPVTTRDVRVHATVVPFCGGVVVGSQRRVAAFAVSENVELELELEDGVAADDAPTVTKGLNTTAVLPSAVALRDGAVGPTEK
jgi:hypothetical protein